MKANLSLLVAAAIITGVTTSQVAKANEQPKEDSSKEKNSCKAKDSCKGHKDKSKSH